MITESVTDVSAIFAELKTLMDGARGVFSIATAETDSAEDMAAGIDKLLEDFKVYTEEITEDLYVGDSFDDETLIFDSNLSLDTGAGVVTLKVMQTVDY